MSTALPPRYSSGDLPAYRHVPGQTPHPLRDPQGHSHGQGTDPATLPDLNHSSPADCTAFRFGIDLFNQRYWWECHEVLEGLWKSSGQGSAAGHVLQAVIQCAAAHLKLEHEGRVAAAGRLFSQAEHHVHRAEGLTLGLDLVGLLAETGALVTADTRQPARLFWHDTSTGAR